MTVELRSRNRHGAFSLLELIIIMIIAGIIASIALPRYSAAIAQRRVSAAAWRIALDLSSARRQARIRGEARSISFDISIARYEITSPTVEKQTVELTYDPYQASITAVDFGGDMIVQFDGYGSPDSGGSIVVQAGNARKTVTLDAQSGLAVVQ